jgi:hypothetical protein
VIASSVIEEAEILHASLRAGSVAQIVVAMIAIVGFLYLLKFVMVTILLALLLAFILEPLAHQLTRISLPRPAAALIRLLGQLKKRRRAGYVPAGAFVNAYLGLGDNDEAFAWFERAYEEQSNILIYIKVSPLFDPLRGDPPEQSRRAATTRNGSSHGPCRKHGRSHVTTLPPSNGARYPSSAPQKAHTVFLVS